ncbi:MAG: DUF3168 domain-containing protein [Paracoccus sp. (in: a-proteobacteria)]|nr:DUF3168 domain-containing protein [Paracoccus sp. (in: a-proteobacteria)]
MSYRAAAALQAAVYDCLCADVVLGDLVGDAIFDAAPVTQPAGVHVALGPEEVRAARDTGGAVSRHDFVVSVMAGHEAGAGFAAVKQAAGAVSAALEQADLATDAGRVAGLWFLRARARRMENGVARRVDLTFRAVLDLA